MSMPIRAAVGASSATARIPRPSFVLLTVRSRNTIITTAVATIDQMISGTCALPMLNTLWSGLKNGREGVALQPVEQLPGELERNSEAPIALIRKASFGAPLRSQRPIGHLFEQPSHGCSGERTAEESDQHGERD